MYIINEVHFDNEPMPPIKIMIFIVNSSKIKVICLQNDTNPNLVVHNGQTP